MRGLFYREHAPGQCFRVDGTAHSSGHLSPFVSSVCLHVIIVHPGLQASESHTELLGTSDAAPNSCMFCGEWHPGHEWVKMHEASSVFPLHWAPSNSHALVRMDVVDSTSSSLGYCAGLWASLNQRKKKKCFLIPFFTYDLSVPSLD